MNEINNAHPKYPTKVSVVTVNYRSWDKLRNCLESLLESNPPNLQLELIVVDNDSNDGQLAQFKEQFPSVNFILNDGNFGFANGCNVGAKVATGDFLFFVNPDTVVPKGVLETLAEVLITLPVFSIAATQKRTTSGKYERIERFFPRWYTLTGIGKALHRMCNKRQIEIDFAKEKEIVFPEWVSGSVIFMRRHDFEQLNGWNEKYWMYSEDVDLCKRASSKGGKIALIQSQYIIHDHGGSSRINPITSALTKSEVYISRHIYLNEHHSGIGLIALQSLLVMKTLVKTALMALVSLLLISHPKAKVSRLLFLNLCRYYLHALTSHSWLSIRSRWNK